MRTIRFNILLVAMALMFTGCLNDLFEQKDNTISSDVSQVEWYPVSRTVTEPASGGATTTTSIEIQLIKRTSPGVTATYEVDGASTAVAGTHYNIVTGSPVAIAADTWESLVTIEILDSPLTSAQSGTLILNLTGGDGVSPAANYATHTLTILGAD